MRRPPLRSAFVLGVLAGLLLALVRARRQETRPTPAPLAAPPAPPPAGPPPPDRTPVPVARPVTAAAAVADPPAAWVAPVDGGCPDGYPIKAKESSGIYHRPGGLSYDRTRPDRCYADEVTAEADGFRAAKR